MELEYDSENRKRIFHKCKLIISICDRLSKKGYEFKNKMLISIDYTFISSVYSENRINTFNSELMPILEWLRVNHSIWIYTYPVAPHIIDNENYPKIVWVSKICSLNQLNFEKFIDANNGLAVNHHLSSQDAYCSAIDYVLVNNLI